MILNIIFVKIKGINLVWGIKLVKVAEYCAICLKLFIYSDLTD